MKKIVALIMVALMACGALASCMGTADGDKANIQKAGKILVGITDYEPMDYQDENGNWIGFDAELAEMFADSLGVECVFVEIVDWDMKVGEINSKQIDVIWNGMTASESLGQEIDFSVSYAKNAQVAVAKKGTVAAADVAAASIAVENGSAGETVVKEVIGATNINEVGSQLDALMEVASGTSQVAVIDITMAQSVVGKGEFADLEIIEGASYGDEIFAVGLRQGSDLKADLDAFLKAKYADGTMTALAEKYGVGLNTDALK